jgi:hypothetical protein
MPDFISILLFALCWIDGLPAQVIPVIELPL